MQNPNIRPDVTPPSPRVTPTRHRRGSVRWVVLVLLIGTVAATFFFGIQPRREAFAALEKETANRNVMAVSVISAKASGQSREVVLPGNVQAFSDTSIGARTGGYVKRWHAEIGQRVKAGDLLVELDTPEVDDQLRQAVSELEGANASYQLAVATATRWEDLAKTGIVTKQDLEERRGQLATRKAALEGARFNTDRLRKLQAFKRLYAPFAGVITARNVDVGTLVAVGGSSTSRELYHLAATHRMRVFVNVPQIYAHEAVPGIEAELTLAEFPGKHFKGTLARSSQAIDASSRTLLAEVDVDNAAGELLPGSYAEVHLKLAAATHALTLPVNALLFRSEGVMVAIVTPDQHAKLVPIKLGRDFGTELEIASGLTGTESIIINPSDSLASGTPVRVVKLAPLPAKPKS